MFTTKKGSENWEWRSKEQREQHDANIMKDREPKLTKRRSHYRLAAENKNVGSEQQTPATNDEDVETRPKVVIRLPGRKELQFPTAKKEKQEALPKDINHTQNEPDSDVQMTDNTGPSDQKQYIQALLHELTTRDNQVKQLQQENAEQKQTIQELTTANLHGSMNASLQLQNRNHNLKADNADLQKRLKASENRNAELEEENSGLRAAYDALLNTVRGSTATPNHGAILDAVNTTVATIQASQPRKCQGFEGELFEHTETYICEDPKHPASRDSISCSVCTQVAIAIAGQKGREVAQRGGIVVTICQRCCWENGEHLTEECKCLTANRCVLCVNDLLNKMAEDAKDMAGMDLEKCSHCGEKGTAEEEKIEICLSCRGRRG